MIEPMGEEQNELQQARTESGLVVETAPAVFVFQKYSPFFATESVNVLQCGCLRLDIPAVMVTKAEGRSD